MAPHPSTPYASLDQLTSHPGLPPWQTPFQKPLAGVVEWALEWSGSQLPLRQPHHGVMEAVGSGTIDNVCVWCTCCVMLGWGWTLWMGKGSPHYTLQLGEVSENPHWCQTLIDRSLDVILSTCMFELPDFWIVCSKKYSRGFTLCELWRIMWCAQLSDFIYMGKCYLLYMFFTLNNHFRNVSL